MTKRFFAPLAIACLLISSQAFAHARLEATSPTKGSTVAAPKTLSLTFDDPVMLTSVKLTHDGKEMSIDVGKPKPGTTVSADLPALAQGVYTVRWGAIAEEDGHAMTGSFGFTVSDK